MAPATTASSTSAAAQSQSLIRINGYRHRTSAPFRPESRPAKKFKLLSEVMARAQYAVAKEEEEEEVEEEEEEDYSALSCEQCGSGENPDELLLCDKCDKGFHMKCLRPIVARVPIGSWLCPKCSGQRRVRSRDFCFFFCF